MNTKSKTHKKILPTLFCLLFIISFLSLSFVESMSNSQIASAQGRGGAPSGGNPATPGSTGSGQINNALLLIGEKCHDLVDNDDDDLDGLDKSIGSVVLGETTCHGWEELVQENLGCGDLFYTHEFETDPQDDSVKETKWYTNEGAYKECYNRAKAQFDLLDSDRCKTVARDSPDWEQCETNQNQLHAAIGCSGEMFEEVNSGHWSPKSAELSACEDQVTRIGNVNIIVYKNGKYGPSKNKIKDGAVKADDSGTSGSTSDEDGEQSCGAGANFSLSWILCPLIEGGTDVSKSFFNNILQELLGDIPISSSRKDPGYKAWSSFRWLANIVIVGALLALVYGTARGGK